MSEKLKPCPFCGIEPYACTEGWSGGTRYAHEVNGCFLSRVFIQGQEKEALWNRRHQEQDSSEFERLLSK